MKITVFYSSDAAKSTDLNVEPTDTVKSVKQKIIAKHPPPHWANTALLSHRGDKQYFENKAKLSDCYVQDGTALRFAYAKTLTPTAKLELNLQGHATEEFLAAPLAVDATTGKVEAYRGIPV
eukprot:CAMPEP_0179332782 /NCGR_PEP_ID=MMETSP0797-20121207/64934_1 /TAXON_ID=47934 /ORGANISM="Dinophysis acuminata, Strain DAEP01" /LENGTH=121 /DNA_ID=CAMNT_0021045707 /DNA_START=64 /DNA_END=429 /DNA_ORIENTATION=+